MKTTLTIMVSTMIAVSGIAAEPLKVGDKAPAFEAQSNDGTLVKSADLYGKKPVVIYFYPKDDTPGCTKQACGIRDDYAEFRKLGAAVFGVSFDSVDSHKKFIQKYSLPFPLLADTEKKVAKAFGAADDNSRSAARMTFVIGLDGKIAYANPKANPSTHSAEVREVLAKLPAQK